MQVLIILLYVVSFLSLEISLFLGIISHANLILWV